MFFFQNYLSKAADLEMKREHKRNIKVRAKSELDIVPSKKTKTRSFKEKHGMSMCVVKPKKASRDEKNPSSLNSQHSTYSCTSQRSSPRLKNNTQIKVRP